MPDIDRVNKALRGLTKRMDKASKDLWKCVLDEDIEEYVVRPYQDKEKANDAADAFTYAVSNLKPDFKTDQGKPRLDLVPPLLVKAVGTIMTYGIDKYQEESWRTVEPKRYKAAMYRHWLKYLEDPKSKDEESGYYHLWHVACNVAFLLVLDGLED
jgi:hypothetical protein